MRKVAIAAVIVLAAVVSCTSEADVYIQSSTPSVQEYVGLVDEFNTVFKDGIPADPSTFDLNGVADLADKVLTVESKIAEARPPASLSSSAGIEEVRIARVTLLGATNALKTFLNAFEGAIGRYDTYDQIYAKMKEELEPMKKIRRLEGDQLEGIYNLLIVKYQLIFEHEFKNQQARIDKTKKYADAFQETNREFGEYATRLYKIDLPTPVTIDQRPLAVPMATWKAKIEPLTAITSKEDLAKVYKTLEFE